MKKENLTEVQKLILKEFFAVQCDEEDGHFNDDETPLVSYNRLERELKITKARLRPEVIELRNAQILELSPAIDQGYMPSGSGYMLTESGVNLAKELFL